MRRKKQDEGERRKEICLSSAALRETEREAVRTRRTGETSNGF